MGYKFEKAKILLVDDMPAMLNLMKSILNTFGFREIELAQNGKEAFNKAKIFDPDLIITDWMMDEMDGIELTKKIRKDPISANPYVPIIIMTGFSAKPRVVTARDKGTTEFLVKPFTSRDLYNKIVQVIERPRQFIDAEDFFGPDRRRKIIKDYTGPKKRAGEDNLNQPQERRLAADLLKKLKNQTKDQTS